MLQSVARRVVQTMPPPRGAACSPSCAFRRRRRDAAAAECVPPVRRRYRSDAPQQISRAGQRRGSPPCMAPQELARRACERRSSSSLEHKGLQRRRGRTAAAPGAGLALRMPNAVSSQPLEAGCRSSLIATLGRTGWWLRLADAPSHASAWSPSAPCVPQRCGLAAVQPVPQLATQHVWRLAASCSLRGRER
jgi:hypothetical protein